MADKLSMEDVVVRKVGDKVRTKREKNMELLQRVHDCAQAQKQADIELRRAIAEAANWDVPMTHIARAWGKTEGAVRMYLKRREVRRG